MGSTIREKSHDVDLLELAHQPFPISAADVFAELEGPKGFHFCGSLISDPNPNQPPPKALDLRDLHGKKVSLK